MFTLPPRHILPSPSPRRLRNGFTLMEIMVVIAIIVVLMGLIVGVSAHARESARIRQTHLTLHTLDLIMKDYLKENAEPPIPTETDYWKNPAMRLILGGAAYDETCVPDYTKTFPASITSPKVPAPTSDPIYWVKALNAFAPKSMAPLTKSVDPSPQVNTVILDAWGTPIRYVPYNIDGTKKEGYFQSAGPDRIFMDSANVAANATKPYPPDDLYSTDPF
jgi:prepilin-type N-terminal cleavage/methylation domain-containing protein